MTTAIQPTNVILGEYADIEVFAKRIKQLMRGGEKLSNNDAMGLAQFSKVTGLNPFIGECWWIPGSGAMVGIAGARRLEQEQARQTGGASFPNITVCDAAEAGATEAELKDVVAAFRCEINDSHASWAYQKMFSATLDSLRQSGVIDPVPVAREICGPRPSWVGYGYSKKSEPSRMNKIQLARKRAEADALKKRIAIPFGAEISDSDVSPDYIDAPAEDAKPKRTVAQNLKELGFDDHEKHHEIGLGNTEKDFPKIEAVVMSYDQAAHVIVATTTGAERFMSELSVDQLNRIWLSDKTTAEQKDAAKIVLKQDFQLEPPTA